RCDRDSSSDVSSSDLIRAMSPLDSTLANALRVKLGKGRDLPEAPKPKRVPKPRVADEAADAATVGDALAKKPASRSRKTKTEERSEERRVGKAGGARG